MKKFILKWKSKSKVAQLCPTLCHPVNYIACGILQVRVLEWIAVSSLQGIFPIQGSNPGLPHHRQILYQLSYQGSIRILVWIAYSFSRGSSQPRDWTRVSWIAAKLPGKPNLKWIKIQKYEKFTHKMCLVFEYICWTIANKWRTEI